MSKKSCTNKKDRRLERPFLRHSFAELKQLYGDNPTDSNLLESIATELERRSRNKNAIPLAIEIREVLRRKSTPSMQATSSQREVEEPDMTESKPSSTKKLAKTSDYG